jgi:hypothetical protein
MGNKNVRGVRRARPLSTTIDRLVIVFTSITIFIIFTFQLILATKCGVIGERGVKLNVMGSPTVIRSARRPFPSIPVTPVTSRTPAPRSLRRIGCHGKRVVHGTIGVVYAVSIRVAVSISGISAIVRVFAAVARPARHFKTFNAWRQWNISLFVLIIYVPP